MRRFSSFSGPLWGGCCQTSRNSRGGVTAECSNKPGVRVPDCARALRPPHANRAIKPAMAHAGALKHLRVLKKVEIMVPPFGWKAVAATAQLNIARCLTLRTDHTFAIYILSLAARELIDAL